MAKELAMVERNKKGKQARRYFIDCEKQLKQKQKQITATPHDLIEHCDNPQSIESALYQSYHAVGGVGLYMVIRNGKVTFLKQLKKGEIVVDVAELAPLFSAVKQLNKGDIQIAALAATQ